jgi:hypothetical protein
MIRKPYMHTFAAVLAALGVLVGTVHYEKGGLARAEGATQLKVGDDRTPDFGSQVLAGRLVRVVDGNATPCERPSRHDRGAARPHGATRRRVPGPR